MTRIEIKESPTMKICVAVTTYKDKKYVDIRKHFKKGEEWVRTAKGIMMQPESVDAVIKALTKLKGAAAEKASQVATGESLVKYVIATSREQAYLKKTGFHDTLQAAANKPFPKTMSQTTKMAYRIFKVLVQDGAVVRTSLQLVRKGDKWVRPLKNKNPAA